MNNTDADQTVHMISVFVIHRPCIIMTEQALSIVSLSKPVLVARLSGLKFTEDNDNWVFFVIRSNDFIQNRPLSLN